MPPTPGSVASAQAAFGRRTAVYQFIICFKARYQDR